MCADVVGAVAAGSDSRRACGKSFGREHTSAATMTLKLGLAGQHSWFFRGEVGQIRGAYGEHTSAATTMLTMVLGVLVLRWPAFWLLQKGYADWVEGVLLGSDSRRAFGHCFWRTSLFTRSP